MRVARLVLTVFYGGVDVKKDKKDRCIHIRVSELEEAVIKDKAEILNLTVTDYVKECCIFSSVTEMFMEKLHGVVHPGQKLNNS